MSIINYSPNKFTPISFRHLLDTFYNDSCSNTVPTSFVPNVDTIERKDSFVIHVEAPGMSKGDFKVELNGDTLTVSGERKFKWNKEKENLHGVETLYGSFSRSFVFPEQTTDPTSIKAEYNNGILELVIPKVEQKQPKLIDIK